MYGYLRDLNLHKSPASKTHYRGYYCGMCCAITRVLGGSKVLINNKDVVSIAIILKLNKGQHCTAGGCYYFTKKGKSKYSAEWLKMVMFAIAILYSKGLDDLHDDNIKKGNKKLKIVEKPFQKILKIVPNFKDQIKIIMDGYFINEKECSGVYDQGILFGNAVIQILTILFDIDEIKKEQIRTLMLWYCLVDALDDYNDDYIKDCENPLFKIAKYKNIKLFKKEEIEKLFNVIEKVKERMLNVVPNPCEDEEDVMIKYYFEDWCPFVIDNLLIKNKILDREK